MVQILKNAPHPLTPQGSDVGYDLVAISEPNIVGESDNCGRYRSIQYIEYDTGVKLCGESQESHFDRSYRIPCYYSLVYPRSSISKYNLVLANSVGIIDPGYTDSIKVRFKYLFQPFDFYPSHNQDVVSIQIDQSKIYQKGDKIAQLIFAQKFTPQIEFVDKLKKTKRGFGGFGSTGK
ncbi:MAG: Deoxyuridine 5'-triphosphate nucleotidohydrolase [Ignavibacteriaceae bacterium]|nr:Deoxyuridine 5'-triphosphate nucleotidohydrolase [Ignavibacteriaceae bacterium]